MINDLKDLQKLLKLCRAQGVTDITLGEVSIKLGDLPQDYSNTKDLNEEVKDKYANFPDGDLTPDQLAFYSSGGLPENDPFREDIQ